MSRRLEVATNGIHRDYWMRFKNYCYETSESPYFDIFEILGKEFNGRNIKNSPYVEFETEEDATAFLLRWSA